MLAILTNVKKKEILEPLGNARTLSIYYIELSVVLFFIFQRRF